jgi:NAD(P)-dependent dehydrogenase (short-subunit alcohol dehydrogenase family)
MELAEQVAIVTGGTSGIGRAVAARLVDAGARVAILGRSDDDGRRVEAELRRRAQERGGGGDCLYLHADVSHAGQVGAAVARVCERWDAIDVIVNNAAIMKIGRLVDTEEADWDATMAVNLKGPFLVCKHALPRMRPQGAIVMVSSVHAAATDDSSAAYTASKGGLEALTRALAVECHAQQIRVNAVRLGAVDTAMLWDNPNVKSGHEAIEPLEVGEPEEVAEAVLFLASRRAAFISGAVLDVDGGRLALLGSYAKREA